MFQCGVPKITLKEARPISTIIDIEEFARKHGVTVTFSNIGTAGIFGLTMKTVEQRMTNLQASGLTQQVCA